jgi:hypothetical protein
VTAELNDTQATPLVYFARAIDGEDPQGTLELANHVRADLLKYGMRMIDPFACELQITRPPGDVSGHTDRLVRLDLTLLRKSDAILIDMTIPGHSYIGCVCELTYAFLWNIPAVVYVGDSGNGGHHWLTFHATIVCRERNNAIDRLHQTIVD